MTTGMRMGPLYQNWDIVEPLNKSALSNVSVLDTCLYQPWLQRALARYTSIYHELFQSLHTSCVQETDWSTVNHHTSNTAQ